MQEAGPHFKLGRHKPGGGMVEHRHPHVFWVTETGLGRSLTIAPSEGHIEILARLAALLPGPYRLVYELIDPFEEFLAGRYAWPDTLDLASLRALIASFAEFLAGDARHNLEIEGDDGSRLTYDQHNFIYAHGDVAGMEAMLLELEFAIGEATLPSPHSHHVRSEFTAKAREFLNLAEWRFASFPEEE